MSHRPSSHANDSASESRRTPKYFSYFYPAYDLEKDSSIDSESEPEASSRIMAGRPHRNTAHNTNPPNETIDEVTRQLDTALPNLLTQLVQALRGNQANQREATPSCSIKTFRASAQSWDDFKKLLMEEYCLDDEVQKLESEFWNHKMVGSDIDGYMARFHELERLVSHMVTPESQRGAVSMANRLTTDGIKDGLFKKKENVGKKRSKVKDNVSMLVNIRSVQTGTSIILDESSHYLKRKSPNPVLAIEGNTNQGNNRNRAQGRAFGLGVAKAPQDPNVVKGTFSLNDHFAIVLFDSGADYSFISTNFLPLINMKPSVISLDYEIEIASDVKVETNKIIRGCRLELEGHTFIIDLIPFGYGSFNVIVGIDWLSKLRAKIVCYGKIIQVLLSNRDILEVHGERPEGNMKQLKTMKVNEPKLEDIPVVREFLGVFLEDLSGLPPSHEVEF
ncbi:putative reverse transcriptase domain-containing protein [Tanacetum coccineum]